MKLESHGRPVVMLAVGQALVRRKAEKALARHARVQIAEDAREARTALASSRDISAFVCDVHVRGAEEDIGLTLELMRAARFAPGRPHVLALSPGSDPEVRLDLLEASEEAWRDHDAGPAMAHLLRRLYIYAHAKAWKAGVTLSFADKVVLSPPQSEALILVVEELRYKEMVEVLGISLGALKSRLAGLRRRTGDAPHLTAERLRRLAFELAASSGGYAEPATRPG